MSFKDSLESLAAGNSQTAAALAEALRSTGELADLELEDARRLQHDAEGSLTICSDQRSSLQTELDECQLRELTLTTQNATLTERRDYWRQLYRECASGATPAPAPARFPKDPGIDRVAYGWDVEGSLAKYMGPEITRIGALAGDSGFQPAWCHKYSALGENHFGTGGDARWAAMRGINVYLNYEVGTIANCDRLLGGEYDSWIRQQGLSIIEMGEQFDIAVGIACSNEPDNPREVWCKSAAGRLKLRQAPIYIMRKFAELGVGNVFMTTPSLIPQTFHLSQQRLAAGTDWWGEYHPLLLPGVDPREWESVFKPPREAFSDEFFCMICTNQYCWHPMNGALKYDPAHAMWQDDWTPERYLKHTPLNDSDGKHMLLCDTVAKALGEPIMIGEKGWFPYEKRAGVNLDLSLQLAEKVHRELADVSEVAIVLWWKQVYAGTDAQVSTSAQAFGARMDQPSDYPAGEQDQHKGQPDPTDARRKMMVRQIQLSEADAA